MSTKVTFLTFFILISSFAFGQSNKLEINIKFKVNEGTLDESQIIVIKKGGSQKKLAGAAKLTLDLDYQSSYIIKFTKPDYITKSIEIDTHVPESNLEEGFEPYPFEVKLFKQYEGVNIVVFNQPVAKIAFSAEADDFDYNVDYTKSIQADMLLAEEELEKKKAEEASKPKGTASPTSTTNSTASAQNPPGSPAGGSSAPPPVYTGSGGGSPSTSAGPPSGTSESNKAESRPKDTTPATTNAQGADQKNVLVANQAAEEKKKMEAQAAEEQKKFLAAKSEEENKKKLAAAASDEERKRKDAEFAEENKKKKLAAQQSEEERNKQAAILAEEAKQKLIKAQQEREQRIQSLKVNFVIEDRDLNTGNLNPVLVSREVIEEKNRTITKVTIKKGPKTIVYSSVKYKWGAEYYFKDYTSITSVIFDQQANHVN